MVKAVKDSLKKVMDEVWSRVSPKLAGKADKDHTHPVQTDVTGNAGTANKLKTARKIGNTSFDGSADITLAQIGAAAASHGTHVSYSADAPKAAGTAAAGSSGSVARSDHVHPVQTDVSGNAGTANKLKAARKIGNASFDGSADVTLAQIGAAAASSTQITTQAALDATTRRSGFYTVSGFQPSGITDAPSNKFYHLIELGEYSPNHAQVIIPYGNTQSNSFMWFRMHNGANWLPWRQVVTTNYGNAVSAGKWNTARKINGLSIDGSADRTSYGTCSTAAGTAAKTVDCSGFTLVTGAEITVKFTVTNTAANPTLNVAGTGAKPVYYRGGAVAAGYLAANRTYTFRYNGTQYELVGDIDTNTNTTYGNMTAATASAAGKAGLVPAPAAGAQNKYLRGDGTWQTPPDTNTTYGNMKAATASAAGGAGLVPAPAAGEQAKYLRGDGTWQNPPNTTYSAATQSANGLMSAADKTKLDKIAAEANKYSHPTTSGNKHIPAGGSSGQILRWSSDGTAAWGADNNTTYGNMKAATASAAGGAGLVPAPAAGAQNKYLRGDGTWQTPPDTNTTYGNMKAATASAAGGAGLVPAPAAGAQAKYLRGDGTWQNPPNTTYGNMGAATASAAGKAGLVPAPAAGAQAKFLRGDGTWQTPPDTNTVYTHPTTAGNKHIPAGGSAGQILKWSAAGTAAWGAAPSQWHHIKKYFELHSSNSGGNNIIGIPLTHVLYVQAFIGNMDVITTSKTKKECWNTKQDSAGSDSLQIGTTIRDIQCTGIVAPSTSKTSDFAIWYPVKGGVQVASSLGIGTATPSANTLIFGAHGVNWQIFMIEIWHDGSFAWDSPWN